MLDGLVSVPVDEPHVYSLDIQMYDRQSDLTAMVSTADSSLNSICRMELCSAGAGFCVDISKTEATYSRQNTSAYGHNYDATVPFGIIAFGGTMTKDQFQTFTPFEIF